MKEGKISKVSIPVIDVHHVGWKMIAHEKEVAIEVHDTVWSRVLYGATMVKVVNEKGEFLQFNQQLFDELINKYLELKKNEDD